MTKIKCPKCGSFNTGKKGLSYRVGPVAKAGNKPHLKRTQYGCSECEELFYYPYIPKK